MPKLSDNSFPSYRIHRSSGQAIVTLNGHDVCLGKYGTPASRAKYNQVIAEWIASGRVYQPSMDDLTVVELVDRYLPFVATYYRRADSTPTPEKDKVRRSVAVLTELYGGTLARDFGPLALKAVRDAMIKLGWCRNHINQSVGRIRRLFKWAVENELIAPAVLHGLQAVPGLRAGRSEARETEPVHPVSPEHVQEILPYCSRQVASMIRLQLITGMRPGEVCQMRGCDIDTSERLWRYRPQQHKGVYHGHERVVYLGPQAKQIVQQFLRLDASAYLFTPADAERERLEAKHGKRRTPLSCGNKPGSNVRNNAPRIFRAHYSVSRYARAIVYACDTTYPLPEALACRRVPRADGKHGMRWETKTEWRARLGEEKWNEVTAWQKEHRFHPHQLRHTAATRLRRDFGLEAAQVILGHKTLTVTQIYAEKNVEAARAVMTKVG